MKSVQRFNKIGRRPFLRLLSFAGIAGVVFPRRSVASFLQTNSRVIIVTNPLATSGSAINAPVVQSMVNGGICSLAQVGDVGEAWKSLLPGVSPGSRIAIKVNSLNNSCPTHLQVTYAVADTLKRMMFNGVPFAENNIIIYDRSEGEMQASGYTINPGTTGIRCLATDTTGVGYSIQTYDVNGYPQRLTRILTEMSDYLINIAVLKNHDTGGVTLCMKNHLGTCHEPGAIHCDNLDPCCPALNALQPIRTKAMVNIIDALFGIRSGGPGGPPQFRANKLIMSTDIVATDYWGTKVLFENGCTTTGQAHYIDTAATTYGLGTNNPNQMDVINIDGATPIQLASFVVTLANTLHVRLDWTTLSETNNLGFEVQRRANGQTDFATLLNSFIPGHGTTIEPHSYSYLDTTAPVGRLWYRLKNMDLDGTIYFTDPIAIDVLANVADAPLPAKFALSQNYPNPFNAQTQIRFEIPQSTRVDLDVYDEAGRVVMKLLNRSLSAGSHSVVFDATSFPSGAYIYQLKTPEVVLAKKLMLIK